MTNRVFVDTSYMVALVNPRDQYHGLAASLARTLAKRPLMTTDAVILEIGNALSHYHRSGAIEVIHRLCNSKEVEVVRLTPNLFDEAFGLYKISHDKTWGLVDCVSFIVMRREGITEALTLDRHFAQAGFRTLMGGTSNGRGRPDIDKV